MRDAEFATEMQRLALEVRPQSGARVEQMVKEHYAYPHDIAEIAAKAIK